MMDARQLIHDRYRFQRYISATKLRRELGRKSGECTWCGGSTLGKAWRNHCSASCRNEVYVRAGRIQLGMVARDNYRCQCCGTDVKKLGKWEYDHVVPVVEGGGCCGMENIRTVCTTCHKAETRKLRERLAKR